MHILSDDEINIHLVQLSNKNPSFFLIREISGHTPSSVHSPINFTDVALSFVSNKQTKPNLLSWEHLLLFVRVINSGGPIKGPGWHVHCRPLI